MLFYHSKGYDGDSDRFSTEVIVNCRQYIIFGDHSRMSQMVCDYNNGESFYAGSLDPKVDHVSIYRFITPGAFVIEPDRADPDLRLLDYEPHCRMQLEVRVDMKGHLIQRIRQYQKTTYQRTLENWNFDDTLIHPAWGNWVEMKHHPYTSTMEPASAYGNNGMDWGYSEPKTWEDKIVYAVNWPHAIFFDWRDPDDILTKSTLKQLMRQVLLNNNYHRDSVMFHTSCSIYATTRSIHYIRYHIYVTYHDKPTDITMSLPYDITYRRYRPGIYSVQPMFITPEEYWERMKYLEEEENKPHGT